MNSMCIVIGHHFGGKTCTAVNNVACEKVLVVVAVINRMAACGYRRNVVISGDRPNKIAVSYRCCILTANSACIAACCLNISKDIAIDNRAFTLSADSADIVAAVNLTANNAEVHNHAVCVNFFKQTDIVAAGVYIEIAYGVTVAAEFAIERIAFTYRGNCRVFEVNIVHKNVVLAQVSDFPELRRCTYRSICFPVGVIDVCGEVIDGYIYGFRFANVLKVNVCICFLAESAVYVCYFSRN